MIKSKSKESNVGINDAYIPFIYDKHRYAILYGSAGSGKSFTAAQKIVLRCINEVGTEAKPFKHRIAAIRKFKTSVKASVYEQIKMAIRQFGIQDLVSMNESYHNFKFWNGAEIFCTGLDEPEKIKSWVATSAWVEEATEFEEGDISQLDLRFRGESEYYKQIILTFNPISESHWIKRVFFDSEQNGMTYILHSTFEDNEFLDEQYKDILRKKYAFDENLNRVYVKGEWGRIKTQSDFYFNFKYDRHVRDNVDYVEKLPLHISFDFNINPYISALVMQIVKKEIDKKPYYFVNVIDEFALTNPMNTTERLCEEIIKKWDRELRYGVYIYGDASGRARGTKSNITDYDIIEHEFSNYMFNQSLRVPKANPLIRKRRSFINRILFGTFNIDIQIGKKCKKLIEDIESAIEEPDGSKKKQMAKDSITGVIYEKHGHHADCLDYMLCEAFEDYFNRFL